MDNFVELSQRCHLKTNFEYFLTNLKQNRHTFEFNDTLRLMLCILSLKENLKKNTHGSKINKVDKMSTVLMRLKLKLIIRNLFTV